MAALPAPAIASWIHTIIGMLAAHCSLAELLLLWGALQLSWHRIVLELVLDGSSIPLDEIYDPG